MINRRNFLTALFAGLFMFSAVQPALAAMRKVKLRVPGCG